MDKETSDAIEKMHGRINDLKQRVTVLETDLPYIRKGVEDIRASISWAVRLIFGAIILATVAFIISGGLKIPN